MKKSWFTNLKGHLLIWFILQLFVSAYISHDMLNNYANWEDNLTLVTQLENASVYRIALISTLFTVCSSAILNLVIVLMTLALVFKTQKRWIEKSISQNIYSIGVQYILYCLMISEVIKYFYVLLGTYTFSEWEYLRDLINMFCLYVGCLLCAFVWVKKHKTHQYYSIYSVLFTSLSITLSMTCIIKL